MATSKLSPLCLVLVICVDWDSMEWTNYILEDIVSPFILLSLSMVGESHFEGFNLRTGLQ